jgi:hypothetical protein
MFLAACFVFWRWLLRPTTIRTLILGFVLGTAAATKFSFLFFFPPAAILIGTYYCFAERQIVFSPKFIRKALAYAFIIGIIASLSIWVWYGFSFGPVVPQERWVHAEHLTSMKILSGGFIQKTLTELIRFQVPGPEFLHGIADLTIKNHFGHAFYLLGRPLNGNASVWFFPVALAVKTPIAFLILTMACWVSIIWRKQWKSTAIIPFAISLAILAICLSSNINLGIRHILPIYPFLAMMAGIFSVKLIHFRRPYGIVVFCLLFGWLTDSSFLSGSDRISYFNEIAGKHPEYFLLDSDLDWGQDLDKMADTLRARKIGDLDISYYGGADLVQHGIPQFDTLRPFTIPKTHWVAMSKSWLYEEPGFAWLRTRQPVATAGKSMVLYYLP